MKSVDLFLGIKAEQTLRDASRAAAEERHDGVAGIELCPVGKKDWIAGERIGNSVLFRDLEQARNQVLKKLIELGSHQRIRSESLRIWAVRKPVPVFKDPLPMEAAEDEIQARDNKPDDGLITCPVCGAEVHSYNIQYNPWGKMVGCYLCRGEPPSGGKR